MNNRYYKKSYDNDLYLNKPYDNEMYYNKHKNKPTLTHNELIETNVLFDPPKKDAVIDILNVTNKVQLYCTTIKYNDFVRIKGYIYKTITYTTTKKEELDRMNKYHEKNMKEKEDDIISQNGADCGCNAYYPNNNDYPYDCECKKHDDKHDCDDKCCCNNHGNKCGCDNKHDKNDKCCCDDKHDKDDKYYYGNDCGDDCYYNHDYDCNRHNGLYRGVKNNNQNDYQYYSEYSQNSSGYWDYNSINDDRHYSFEDQYSNYNSFNDPYYNNDNWNSDDNNNVDDAVISNDDNNVSNSTRNNNDDNSARNNGGKDNDGKDNDGKCDKSNDDKGNDDKKRDPKDPKNGYVAIDGVIRHTTVVIPFDVVLHMEGAQYGDSVKCDLSFSRNSQGNCVMVEENNIIGLKETDVVKMNIYLD